MHASIEHLINKTKNAEEMMHAFWGSKVLGIEHINAIRGQLRIAKMLQQAENWSLLGGRSIHPELRTAIDAAESTIREISRILLH